MKAIQFTQYLFPDGRKRSIELAVSDEVAEKAEQIYKAGYVLEAENNRGMVSLTIADPANEVDLACVLTTNGPHVPKAVEKLIMDFKIGA